MKIKLLQVVLMFFVLNSIEANQKLNIDSKQIKEIMKTNTLHIIGIDEKCKWDKNNVIVKNFQSIGKGFLELKSPKLDFNTYKKNTVFIVFSKKSTISIKFVEKLKSLGFKNVKYFKDGNSSWDEVILGFRGIKLFSIFTS